MSGEPFRAKAQPESDGPWQVLASGERTGGALVVGEANLPPYTSGPSMHVHSREDEATYVVSGVLTVAVGDEVFEVSAGELVWLPRGVPHTFANRSSEYVHAVGVIVPAGLEGMFAEQAAYFAGLSGPPDESAIDAIGAKYGVSRVGPPLDAGP